MVKTFYVKECPHATKCTAKSFKNAACKGYTGQEALDRLIHHLTSSSFHQMTIERAKEVAAKATLTLWDSETNTEHPPDEGTVKVKKEQPEAEPEAPNQKEQRTCREICKETIAANNKLTDCLEELYSKLFDDEGAD